MQSRSIARDRLQGPNIRPSINGCLLTLTGLDLGWAKSWDYQEIVAIMSFRARIAKISLTFADLFMLRKAH